MGSVIALYVANPGSILASQIVPKAPPDVILNAKPGVIWVSTDFPPSQKKKKEKEKP